MLEESRRVPCELLSWDQCDQMARRLACQIREDGYEPDLIVAIARGGLMPARILSDRLNLFDLATIKVEHYHAMHKERSARVRYPLTADIDGRRVLLVDDVSDSGDTFEVAIRHLRGLGEPLVLKTAVLHHKRIARYRPDYFVEEVVEWRWLIYPWAMMEDLSSFLQEMEPRPVTVEVFAELLQKRHGIDPPRQALEDVLAMN
ncbi:MAG: phosphoribosyltransferase [Pseudomonadota bacterium]